MVREFRGSGASRGAGGRADCRPFLPPAAAPVFWFALLICAAAGPLALAVLARRAIGEDRPKSSRWVWAAAWVAVTGLAVVLLRETYPGRFYIEKTLTRLALPTGLLWLGLLGLSAWAALRRRWKNLAAAATVTAAFTAAANPVVAHLLADTLQRHYDCDPLRQGNFDAVCVLGGGVSLDRHDEPAVNAFGQRAILAARLYHAGRTPVLLAAGTAPPSSTCPGPGEATRDLWTGLAVPAGAVRLIEGTTTSEELASLSEAAAAAEAGGRPWGRIGLLSSAWHLPRAVRLADAAGLLGKPGCEIVPLPADYTGTLSTTAPQWVPDSEALATTDRCVREWLARIVAR